MNFLAHLHIADHCQSSLLGNLLGDFVKGDPSKLYNADVSQGIRLHRFVDSYTDNHAIIKLCKQRFEPNLKRFAPIAMDMFWDHCLAKRWHDYHSQTLQEFVDSAEAEITSTEEVLPERFVNMTSHMWQGRWLESYSDLDNIRYALERMSLRSMRMTPLADCGVQLEQNYQEFSDFFAELYPEVLEQAIKVGKIF
ncbi:ACP phosphodiesterase [Vibrio barjaei]|uniref:ACP phosphodiesterase n=1 Tax=Vibrio barjaei TaxID=1676683 RepID=A0ABW7ICI0_9VIBR|nr:ACP phosphodiesterase [Vibrio barjaei]MCY9871862.1 ACP phosphodiesterase [Vibrio barjaei]